MAILPVAAAPVAPARPYAWGGNADGQLGDATTMAHRLPEPVSGLDEVVDIHGGREHVVALTGLGEVFTWGSNAQGQLGTGASTTNDALVPTRVALSGVVAVETGHNHSMALLADGRVRTWGLNTDGQLGDGSTVNRSSPVTVTGLDDAVAVAAGRNMSFAIRADGTLVGWGRNDEGQLGEGTSVRRPAPARVGSLSGVVGVAGGRDHGLALLDDGTVWAWGSNDYGQVGNGATTDRTLPVRVALGMKEVIAGAHHSYALRTDGQVLGWGRNYRHNLGDGTTLTRTRPVEVPSVTAAVSIASGRDHGLAVRADGTLMAWGHNAFGQLGDGTTTARTRAILVPGVTDAVFAGGGGAEYSVVLTGSGSSANQDPVAAFTSSCVQLSCTFDGTGSTDDGSFAAYDWTFGDGTTGTGASTGHGFLADGAYAVTLTVRDDEGATDSLTRAVEVSSQPPAQGIVLSGVSTHDTNSAQPGVVVPSAVQAGDRLVLVASTNRAATTTTPAGWTLLGSGADGADVRSWVFSRSATAGLGGATTRLSLDAASKTSLTMLAYRGAGAASALAVRPETGSSTVHASPPVAVSTAGSTVLSYWVDKSSTAHGWTLGADVSRRAATVGSGSGMLTSVTGDSAGAPAGTWTGRSATAGVGSSKALSWSIVLPPS